MQEIALHIMDVAENSITADASEISVAVKINEEMDMLAVTVKDNGKGMDDEMLSRVTRPFTTTRTTRKVGNRLRFFKPGGVLKSLHAIRHGSRKRRAARP
jgi:signal transduction histidine kinase